MSEGTNNGMKCNSVKIYLNFLGTDNELKTVLTIKIMME